MSKAAMNSLDKLAHAIIFRNVEGIGIDFHAVQVSCFLGDLVKWVRMAGTQSKLCTLGCECERCCTADSFARCGDDCDPVLQSGFHVMSISFPIGLQNHGSRGSNGTAILGRTKTGGPKI
jgi:hypothetical protein